MRSFILIRNTVYNFFSSIWLLVLHFFTTPYIVRFLGVDAYGIYAIVFVVIGYFGFLELGFGKATIKFISAYYAKKDYEMIEQTISSGILVYLTMGIFGFILIALLTDILVTHIFNISEDLIPTAKFVFYVSAVSFMVNMLCSFFSSIPRALQRFDITNKVGIIVGTIQTGVSVLILYLGFYLKELMLFNLGVSVLTLIIYLIISKKLLPRIKFKIAFYRSVFKEIFKFSGFVALDKVLVVLSVRINSFIIGIFQPISAVTYYVIPETISSKISFIPNSISQTSFPSFSELNTVSKDLTRELFLRSTKYIVILTIPFLIFFMGFSEKFLFYWIGEDISLKSTLIMQILGAAYILSFWAYTSIDGARGLHRPDIPAKIQGILGFTNIVLSIILIPFFGIFGAALAMALPRVFIIPLFIYRVGCKLFEIKFLELWNSCFKMPIILVICICPISILLVPYITSLYVCLFFFFILYIFYLCLSYFFAFDMRDRDASWAYIRKVIAADNANEFKQFYGYDE